MKWTTERPTKPGWYWAWHTIFKCLHVVLINNGALKDSPFKPLAYEGGGEPTFCDVYSYWLGPIEPPEPPK